MAEAEVLKKKKKKLYLVLSKEFNNQEIGETLASEDSLILGRSLEVSLAQLTNDPKTQNVKIRFKIIEVKDGKGYAELRDYSILQTYIKRVVKPGREKVEDSFGLVTKDGVKIRVKPLLLTKSVTQKSVLANMRKKTRNFFGQYCSKNDYSNLLQDLFSHNVQKDLKGLLNKVYPLSVCEIRQFQRL